jgi:tetratricopeptide (TPR) repeat protein/predicted phosphodiesterase
VGSEKEHEEKMTAVTWLHLSDWHQKGKDFGRKIVLRALLKDIRERVKISPDLEKIDFVVFSGDVAFGGKTEEYQAAKEQFFLPLLDACGVEPKQLFIVPGNHDLDRDEFKRLPHDLTKPLSTEKEVQDWLTDDRNRYRLLEPFSAFASFVREYTGQEPPDYANVRRIKVSDKEIALIGLNSAWMCGRNKDKIGDYGFVIVGEPQIYNALEEISGTDLRVAILHHPFDWLREFDRNRIEDSLRQGCDFILRGHQHKPKVEITSGTSGDCVIIPAGASYDRRMAENPRYANSYNFVHLDFDAGNGVVFLRRWSDDGNKWLEDIASCKDGKCKFTLFKSESEAPSQETPASNKTVPHQIPLPPGNFKGREDEIRDILSNFEKGATITGLRGMGGVGKTALALVLADKLKSQFPDGQIFIEMRGTSTNPDIPPLKPEEAMAQVIRAYNPVDRLPENSVELRGLYLKILAGKRALLLLDNAANSEQVYPLLPPEGCSVLITSRIKFALWGLVEQDLDILPPDKARELLLEIAPRIGNWADELAKLCGYLPLALRNAASTLAEKRDLSVSEYERRLMDKVALLKLVKGSFSLSYDLLTPGRKKQWRRLSVFPEDFDRDAATAVLKMAPGPSAEALNDLVRWSLVDFAAIQDSEDGRYKLHDLARLFAESCLEQDELADAQQKHAKYYSKVLSQAEKLYDKGGMNLLAGLKLFDREWANIKIGQAWVKNMIQSHKILKKNDLKSVLQLASSYAGVGSYVFNLRLHPRDRIDWIETGLKAARMMRDQGAQGVHLSNLGLAYADLDETRKAIGYHDQSLNISRKIGNRSGEGADLCNLGNAYAALGETRKAIEYHDQARAISREIGDRRGEGSDLCNLGKAYADLGETRKAIEQYEQALAISHEVGDKRNEGYHLCNLGSAYADLGETRKAIEQYEQALAISREIGDRRGEGNHLGNLGGAYAVLGETRKAIEQYELALAISRETGDRRNEGVWLGNLGGAYSGLGETRKAIEYIEQALAISREIEDRRGEGIWLANLGGVYVELGETRKAIDYYDQALAITRKIGDRRDEGSHLGNLGRAYAALGETHKAIEYIEQALAIAREIGGRRNEGNRLGSLGGVYVELGETRKAIDYYEQALAISREIGDRKDEGEELCNLGKAHLDLNETERAIEYCMQSLDIVRKIEYRKFEGKALCTLGKAYSDLGQLEKAIDDCDQALKIFKDIEYRRGEGEALFTKSQALAKLGQRKEAAALANEAIQIFSQIESPLAEKVRQKLAEWGSVPQEN